MNCFESFFTFIPKETRGNLSSRSYASCLKWMLFDFIVHMKMIKTEALDHEFLNLVLLPTFLYPILCGPQGKYIQRGGFALIEFSFHSPHLCGPISVDSFKDREKLELVNSFWCLCHRMGQPLGRITPDSSHESSLDKQERKKVQRNKTASMNK